MSTLFDQACSVIERPASHTAAGGQFWRSDDPTVEETETGKVVKCGGMFEHQRKFWQLPNFIKVLVGGYGSGKTLIGAKRIISLALQNAPVPVAAVSPTFPLARHTTIATIRALLAGKQTILGRQFVWKYNHQYHEFTIRYRGRTASIFVYSGDDPDALRGPNLGAAWLDEPFLMELAVFEQMNYRVRHPLARHREIYCTGTPEQLNWGYDLCVGEMRDRYDVGMITASTRSNFALPGDYLERLEAGMDEKAALAYIDGAFVNLAKGQVYYGFSAECVVEQPFPITGDGKPAAEFGVGMDFNVNPMAACCWYITGGRMHVFDEIELPNADTEFMCETLRDRKIWLDADGKPTDKKDRRAKQVEYGKFITTVCPDATGSHRHTSAPGAKSDFTYIRAAGFHIDAPPENPKRRERYNNVNGALKSRSGVSRVTVSPRCKKLIKYLGLYNHELMNKQKEMSHLLDAFGYPISRRYPIYKPSVKQMAIQGA